MGVLSRPVMCMTKRPTTSSNALVAIPTNVICGFLGVGKTTAILSLLRQKPDGERWAILVNEFGEVGIDGELLAKQKGGHQGVSIREVPGGCMCCAAGLPMQIALNQLLAQARPHRLLIEPTGLGHPKEVLETLANEHYQRVLSVQHTVTLVDARKLSDSRYTTNDIFNQQIEVADIVVGNKVDQYHQQEHEQLRRYIHQRRGRDIPVYFTQQGKLELSLLDGKSHVISELKPASPSPQHLHHSHPPSQQQAPYESDVIRVENRGLGACSAGWRFSPDKWFDRNRVRQMLIGLDVMRAKAVMITEEGVFGYNLVDNELTEYEMDECLESRIEIIARHLPEDLDSLIEKCLIDSSV